MYLRRLELKDAPLMLAWMHDKSVVEKLKADFDSKTISDCENFIKESWEDKNNINLAVASDTDEYMGTVSLKHIESGSAEFAITVRAEAMGKGYSWFGMETIIEKAFNEYGLECVYWCVSRENVRAVRFYDKHNFHETLDIPTAVLDRYSEMSDLKWYSVLKGDDFTSCETVAGCTSGGAFTAIAQAFCDENYVVYGAAANGLNVFHYGIEDIRKLPVICKSKYSQSRIGDTFQKVKANLKAGKKVLFAGTPCQVAGLKAYLHKADTVNLLLVEVICEGVPSPLYIRKLDNHVERKYGTRIKKLDYRSKGFNFSPASFKWDFERMCLELKNGKILDKDRWFNPYWSIWLKHLMSRPSCYQCPFTTTERQADITLGDLWGVHLYCPELYGENGGASLIVCNTEKGKKLWQKATTRFVGHELDFENALKYQAPMRKHIDENPDRGACMQDLMDPSMDYSAICLKWADPPSSKLLFQKYVWGNRQKVFVWNLRNRNK